METKEKHPTQEELLRAVDKTIPDVIAPGLKVLFCGINPGLYSAAIGHHFGRPGNRFWPTLYAAGFTDRLLTPYEDRELLKTGYGITNVVARTSKAASELTEEELAEGGKILRRKVLEYQPKYLAVLGIGAFRSAFDRPKAFIGEQDMRIGDTRVWALPNPSGLNAHYSLRDLAEVFRDFRMVAEHGQPGKGRAHAD